MSKTTRTARLIAIPLIALLAANGGLMADDKPKMLKNTKATLSTDTLVTQAMAEAALELPCPSLQFSGEHPLSDLLEVFDAHWEKHLAYDLPFFSDHAELDLEGITSLEEVLVRNIKITAGTHTCRDALNLIFVQTTDPQLSYQPVTGHIQVTTLAKVESEDNLLSRVYNLGEFIGGRPESANRPGLAKEGRKKQGSGKKRQQGSGNSPQEVLKQFGGGGGGGLGGGGMSSGQPGSTGDDDTQSGLSMGTMIQLLQEQTSPPALWIMVDGEGGNMSTLGQYLVIRQTPAVHRHIEDILDQLRTAIKIGGAPYIKADPSHGGGRKSGGGMGGGTGKIRGGKSGGGIGPGSGFFRVKDAAAKI